MLLKFLVLAVSIAGHGFAVGVSTTTFTDKPACEQAAALAEAQMKQVFEVRVGPIRTEHKCDDAAKVDAVAEQWKHIDQPGRKDISL